MFIKISKKIQLHNLLLNMTAPLLGVTKTVSKRLKFLTYAIPLNTSGNVSKQGMVPLAKPLCSFPTFYQHLMQNWVIWCISGLLTCGVPWRVFFATVSHYLIFLPSVSTEEILRKAYIPWCLKMQFYERDKKKCQLLETLIHLFFLNLNTSYHLSRKILFLIFKSVYFSIIYTGILKLNA